MVHQSGGQDSAGDIGPHISAQTGREIGGDAAERTGAGSAEEGDRDKRGHRDAAGVQPLPEVEHRSVAGDHRTVEGGNAGLGHTGGGHALQLLVNALRQGSHPVLIGVLDAGDHIGPETGLLVGAQGLPVNPAVLQPVELCGHGGGTDVHRQSPALFPQGMGGENYGGQGVDLLLRQPHRRIAQNLDIAGQTNALRTLLRREAFRLLRAGRGELPGTAHLTLAAGVVAAAGHRKGQPGLQQEGAQRRPAREGPLYLLTAAIERDNRHSSLPLLFLVS